jgi:hypothetical protein
VLERRHHTEGQIAAKKAAAAKKAGNKRQEADEFGPWGKPGGLSSFVGFEQIMSWNPVYM